MNIKISAAEKLTLLPLLPLSVSVHTALLKLQKKAQSQLYHKLANVAKGYGECIKSLLNKFKPYSVVMKNFEEINACVMHFARILT